MLEKKWPYQPRFWYEFPVSARESLILSEIYLPWFRYQDSPLKTWEHTCKKKKNKATGAEEVISQASFVRTRYFLSLALYKKKE